MSLMAVTDSRATGGNRRQLRIAVGRTLTPHDLAQYRNAREVCP